MIDETISFHDVIFLLKKLKSLFLREIVRGHLIRQYVGRFSYHLLFLHCFEYLHLCMSAPPFQVMLELIQFTLSFTFFQKRLLLSFPPTIFLHNVLL